MESSVLKIVEIEGKGRALVTTKPLRGGHIILRDSPILLYSALPFTTTTINDNLSSSSTTTYCSNCFRTLTLQSQSLFSCSSCPHIFFCSPNCQSVSLSTSGSHSPWVCQTLRHLQQSPSLLHHHDKDFQVQSRFLVAAYNLSIVSPSHFQILLSLHGQPSTHDVSSAQLFHSLVHPPPPSFSFSVQLSASLLAKDKLNAFGLMEPDGCSSRSVRAYGIYPKASLFNHDCLPNACRFDYVDTPAPLNINHSNCNTDLIFRLIHDVPQGREICLSYFPVNESYSDRQRRLFEDYGFVCDCDRCKVESNWSDQDDHESMEDEDHDEQMSPASDTENEIVADDFPHSYFFLRYVCNRENCWGTLAPLPPSVPEDASTSQFLECNVCGNLKKDDGFVDE